MDRWILCINSCINADMPSNLWICWHAGPIWWIVMVLPEYWLIHGPCNIHGRYDHKFSINGCNEFIWIVVFMVILINMLMSDNANSRANWPIFKFKPSLLSEWSGVNLESLIIELLWNSSWAVIFTRLWHMHELWVPYAYCECTCTYLHNNMSALIFPALYIIIWSLDIKSSNIATRLAARWTTPVRSLLCYDPWRPGAGLSAGYYIHNKDNFDGATLITNKMTKRAVIYLSLMGASIIACLIIVGVYGHGWANGRSMKHFQKYHGPA